MRSDEQFAHFNASYLQTLQEWGLFRDGINPVARSNLVPTVQPPARAGVHAFSYAVPAAQGLSGFIVAWPPWGVPGPKSRPRRSTPNRTYWSL